jgi:hypothetical protein
MESIKRMPEKYSKLSITAFIISLIPIIIILVWGMTIIVRVGLDVPPLENLLSPFLFPFILFAPIILVLCLVSLILGIISLFLIRKYNLKGRVYAWLSIIISLILIPISLFSYFLKF